jgi:hypothetical protein
MLDNEIQDYTALRLLKVIFVFLETKIQRRPFTHNPYFMLEVLLCEPDTWDCSTPMWLQSDKPED